MASNAGWTKTLPSGQSKVSNTDEEFRSFKSFMEAWWEQEHYATSGSASSAGIAKHGAGRAFVGPSSQLSNPTRDNDGRFLWATDVKRLYIAQASSSSWSLASENVQTTSQQTWTALQEFTSGASFSALSITNGFKGVISYTSTNAADRTITTNGINVQFANPSNVTFGDFILSSFTHDGTGFISSFGHVLSTGTIQLDIVAHGSTNTIRSGSIIKVLAFRANV